MIIQQRLTSRSSRSLAVMIGFAQPAGSRGTWRSDGDIDSGAPTSAPAFAVLQLPLLSLTPFATTDTGYSTRRALGRRGPRCDVVTQRFNRPENRHG